MQKKFVNSTAVIIPVYNEGKVIRNVIADALKHVSTVIAVNDGSKDNSADEIAKTNAILIDHPINMGQGAALQTGLEYARELENISYFVHFDADGQHDIRDVEKMLAILEKGKYDIVLGSRFLEKVSAKKVPLKKRILLKLALWFTVLTTGLKLTDTHNGLRVFNRKAANAIEITLPDMAHASEILALIHQYKLKYTEAPVTIRYTAYSQAKGQPILNAINIVYDILVKGKGK
ncbi:MAG TPA: glycosyltransferase family 2 protein [Candidatus Saccharimonadales bacterium]|nr:glycosyltransferase family 2 protein [Candidatus Saccharimonadales bacterium]